MMIDPFGRPFSEANGCHENQNHTFAKRPNAGFVPSMARGSLGPDKKAAHEKFHELMLNRNAVASEMSTLYDLSQAYLDWCEQNRKKGTYQNHKRYLRGFIDSVGRRLKIGALKTHHITKWLDSFECTTTSKNDAAFYCSENAELGG